MLLADVFAVLGFLCLTACLTFVAMVWWECHCEAVQERYKARETAKWQMGLPPERDQ